jgi:polar amino acid transport system substrate-binding protein
MNRKFTSIVISAALILASGVTFVSSTQAAVKPKAGKVCAKAKLTAKSGATTFDCKKVNKKLVWVEQTWFSVLKKNQALHDALPATIRDAKVITFATDPTDPPFQFYDEKNVLVGAEIDLVKAVGKILGVKVVIVPSGFSAIIPGVEAGRYNASVSAFADRLARQKIVDFVDYFNSSRAFLFKKGTLPNLKTEADICGLKVAVPAGTTMATAIVTLSSDCTTAGKAAIDYSIFPDQSATVLAVKSGRADMTILSAHVSSWIVQNSAGDLDLILRPNEGADVNGMVVQKGGLVVVMQKAIQQLMDDGTFTKIFTKWNVQKLMRFPATINAGTK